MVKRPRVWDERWLSTRYSSGRLFHQKTHRVIDTFQPECSSCRVFVGLCILISRTLYLVCIAAAGLLNGHRLH